MESSPENSKMVVDLSTPLENLKKCCQEITPDNPTQPETKLAVKKACVVGVPQKVSKRKLFGQPGDQALGNENDSVDKKKRTNDPVKTVSNDNTPSSTAVKPPLTERQQLAFLLEATSTRTGNENDKAFTKVKTRKRVKRNGKCVNPRVYRRNERGETPLHIAAIKGDITNIKKLIKDGADVQLKDYAGWTALHEACNHGNFEAAKLLVKHGAAVNAPGFEDDTPLHDAVVNNHVKVVDMLLSRGANPHQTNMKGKKPTDLISSQEMSEVFNLSGVQHVAFEKKDMKACSEESTASHDVEKTPTADHERLHVRGSILGNEIQRKETLGESKMEKPVMYICKLEPRNEEVTIRTTQVTPCKKSPIVEEDGRPEGQKNKPDQDQETGKDVLGVDKNNKDNPGQLSSERSTAVQNIKETVRKATTSSLQVVSHDQPKEVKNTPQSVTTSVSGTETEVRQHKLVSSSDQDNVSAETNVKMSSYDSEKLNTQGAEQSENEGMSINDDIAKEKLPVTSNEFHELTEPTKEIEISEKKQDSVSAERKENENIITESSSVMVASEKPTVASQETKNSTQVDTERSRTPEIDESIAVEVLCTGLLSVAPGFSQCYAPISMGLQDNVTTPSSYVNRGASVAQVCTSGNHRSVGYDGVSVGNVPTSRHERLGEPEANEQSFMPTDDLFLDVESFEPDMKEHESEVEKYLPNKAQSSKQAKEQDNVISSTSNNNDDDNESTSFAIPSSGVVEHTDTTSWKFDNTTAEKDHNRYDKGIVSKNSEEQASKLTIDGNNIGNLTPWRLEKKSRGRKSLRSSTFTREDKTTKRITEQPDSNVTSLEENARSSSAQRPRRLSQDSKERLSLDTAVLKLSKPAVTWQSLVAAGKCKLDEVRVPGYDQFLMKTKNYELAKDVNRATNIQAPVCSMIEGNETSLKLEKSRNELLRKQRSEQDKLQLCMEQEIVRFYTRQAYSPLKSNLPPGVCTALYWQNMSPRQLQNEKKKLSQKPYFQHDQPSPSGHQDIIEKYQKLKIAMENRHKHEQQALDAVIKRELQSCV